MAYAYRGQAWVKEVIDIWMVIIRRTKGLTTDPPCPLGSLVLKLIFQLAILDVLGRDCLGPWWPWPPWPQKIVSSKEKNLFRTSLFCKAGQQVSPLAGSRCSCQDCRSATDYILTAWPNQDKYFHLLQSIANIAQKSSHKLKYTYCTSESYIPDFWRSVWHGNAEREKKRNDCFKILVKDGTVHLSSKQQCTKLAAHIFCIQRPIFASSKFSLRSRWGNFVPVLTYFFPV